jgi:hypothetical protein
MHMSYISPRGNYIDGGGGGGGGRGGRAPHGRIGGQNLLESLRILIFTFKERHT